jgi:hypothetical protein
MMVAGLFAIGAMARRRSVLSSAQPRNAMAATTGGLCVLHVIAVL